MHVLITGGAGFIGSHLTHFHLKRGDTVEVIDDFSTGSHANLASIPYALTSNLTVHEGSVLDWDGLDKVVARADRIYHMAAIVGMFRVLREPVEVIRVNIWGTERVLEAAVKGGRKPQIVIPSSSSVYGTAEPDQLHEEAPLKMVPGAPLLNYAISKLTNEVQGLSYFEKHGLQVAVARLFNTVGPRQCGLYGFVLPRFVQQAISNSPITVFGDGSQTRSFCDVRDTIAILDSLASCKTSGGRPVNVGNTQEITILELARVVKALTGSSSPIEFVPFEKAYGQSFQQIPQRRPLLDRMRSLTGYHHQWTLDQSILGLCEHYRQLKVEDQAKPAPVAEEIDRSYQINEEGVSA